MQFCPQQTDLRANTAWCRWRTAASSAAPPSPRAVFIALLTCRPPRSRLGCHGERPDKTRQRGCCCDEQANRDRIGSRRGVAGLRLRLGQLILAWNTIFFFYSAWNTICLALLYIRSFSLAYAFRQEEINFFYITSTRISWWWRPWNLLPWIFFATINILPKLVNSQQQVGHL